MARDPEGCRLVKEVRRQLSEGCRSLLNEMIGDLTVVRVVNLHGDISVHTGERDIVFGISEDLPDSGGRAPGFEQVQLHWPVSNSVAQAWTTITTCFSSRQRNSPCRDVILGALSLTI
ncbi:MAG: DUF2294 family protein [Anaerolineales bacterium]|nr:MAG: DUF2294 family protein [Anaerolineales bacterium]